MATKQIIQIEVTWAGWSKLKLAPLIAWLASVSEDPINKDLGINRISVKEIKK